MKNKIKKMIKKRSFIIISIISYIILIVCIIISIKNAKIENLSNINSNISSVLNNQIENEIVESNIIDNNIEIDKTYSNSSINKVYNNNSKVISSSKPLNISVAKNNMASSNQNNVNSSSNTNIITETEYITLPSINQLVILENKIFNLLNKERERVGINKLTNNNTIRNGARIRALESGKYKHKRPDGRSYHTVFNEVNYGVNKRFSSGENIATFSKSTFKPTEEQLDKLANMIFNSWINSPSHYKNMIDSRFTEVGIGFKAKIEKKDNIDMIFIEAVQLFSTGI